MPEVSDVSTENIPQSENNILVGNLVRQTTDLLQQDRNTPEYSHKAQSLMSALEQVREKLGNYCVTVGEGEDRTVVMVGALTGHKTTLLVLEIQPDRHQGTLVTTYKSRVFVNKAGVFEAINIVDQQFDGSDEQTPQMPESDLRRKWEERVRPMVQWAGEVEEKNLQRVLDSGKYTTLDDIPLRSIPGSGEKVIPEEEREYREISEAYRISEYVLSPRWKEDLPMQPLLTDAMNTVQPERGWHTSPGIRIVKITKPETIDSVFKASVSRPNPSTV